MAVTILGDRRRAVRLQEAWKVAALAQLVDTQLLRSGPDFPVPVPVAVVLNQPIRRTFALPATG